MLTDATRDAIARLQRGALANAKDILTSLMEDADAWKAPEYDGHVDGLRLRYEGKGAALLKQALQKRYPATVNNMTVVSHNIISAIAEADASVFSRPPDWWLAKDGVRIDATPPVLEDADEDEPEDASLTALRARAARFASMLRDAQIDLVMLETERRCSLPRSHLVRVDFGAVFASQNAEQERHRVILEPYWPSDVKIIPHPSRPSSIGTAVALLARISGPSGVRSNVTWWEVWTRSVDEDEHGKPTAWGPWYCNRISSEGETQRPWGDEPYPLPTLPWALVHLGIAQGSPFFDVDRDLGDNADAYNINAANILYTVDMQAHSEGYYAGDTKETSKMVGGPGVIHQIGVGETMGVLDYSPKLEAMQEVNSEHLRTLALTRSQSRDAYQTKTGAPSSGVARRIENAPQSKKRRELEVYWKAFAAEQLLPLMVEVWDHWGASEGDEIGGDGITFHLSPQPEEDFEDPEAKQRRAFDAMDRGILSPARAAVLSGHYRSLDDAIRAGLSDKVKQETLGLSDAPRLSDILREQGETGDDSDEETVAVEAAPAPAAPVEAALQETALNGAQVASLLSIVEKVAMGALPADTAREVIAAAFPGIRAEQLDRMLSSLRGFTPPAPEQPAAE
jgi:Arc/MetJ-type ribon-helix-helix transcriptional regulator